jgi:hypothetical protein
MLVNSVQRYKHNRRTNWSKAEIERERERERPLEGDVGQ